MRISVRPLAATASATECSPLMRESSDQPDHAPSNPPPSARGVTAEQPSRTSSPGNATALSDTAVVGRWTTGDVTRAAVGVLAVWYGLQLFWAVNAFVFLIFLRRFSAWPSPVAWTIWSGSKSAAALARR